MKEAKDVYWSELREFAAASNLVDLIDPKAIVKQETNHD